MHTILHVVHICRGPYLVGHGSSPAVSLWTLPTLKTPKTYRAASLRVGKPNFDTIAISGHPNFGVQVILL
jgi:hypothetical protein